MTLIPHATPSRRPVFSIPAINFGLVIFLLLYAGIAILQPSYLQAGLFMNFLRRAAPLIILASGQLYVILTGGFDLSMGAVVTLVVLAASILVNGDPNATWPMIGVLYLMGLAIGLVNGIVVAFLKVPSIVTTLGTMLLIKGLALAWSGGAARGDLPDNFRDLGRFVARDVWLIGTLPIAVIVLIVFMMIAGWGLHGTVYGKRAIAVGDNARAAELAGMQVAATRITAFVVSALAAVTAGILVGGFSGVSVNAGNGFELQAIAACVVGGAQLLGGRGTIWSALFGALSLFTLFTLLNLAGLPQALRDSIQGLILITAVGASAWRDRRKT
ncbi:ABC transporter permease [Pararobbsia alpina]|uniref:L-arabinose transport system permease protein AraH n=1 Tax=Pararobbsia alpina TaxID=621374 RepID=A0A6S7D656_9BURK|nr:ABC transporter permease [Pararobbsia alpina]CAB3797179.1 L-arabinose transport system permease protein AraH [Pararobbsia alpina]